MNALIKTYLLRVSHTVLVLTVCLLSACDDRELVSSPLVSTPSPVLMGKFMHNGVSGLRYESATQSGVTGASGEFEYVQDEVISFYLGRLLLGSTSGKAVVTPFDLVPDAEVLTGIKLARALQIEEYRATPKLHTVIGIAMLLQTFDRDGNTDNGIEINPDLAFLFAPDSVDFERKWWTYRNDTGIHTVLAAAKSFGLLPPDRRIRPAWQATKQLYSSLDVDSRLRRLSRVNYFDSSGNPTNSELLAYNHDGQLIERKTFAYESGNERVEQRREYNEYGEIARILPTIETSYPQPYTVYVYEYVYDDNGNRVSLKVDSNEDSVFDSVTYIQVSPNGLPLEYLVDFNADGEIDVFSSLQYDENNNLLLQSRDYVNPGPYTTDSVVAYEYDADGRLVVRNSDIEGSDGSTVYYEYDASGGLISEKQDHDSDGVFNAIELREYDNGLWTFTNNDYDGDGVVDGTASREYDADGRIVKLTRQSNNGTTNIVELYEYDADGLRVRKTRDYVGSYPTTNIVTVTTAEYEQAEDWYHAFHSVGNFFIHINGAAY